MTGLFYLYIMVQMPRRLFVGRKRSKERTGRMSLTFGVILC